MPEVFQNNPFIIVIIVLVLVLLIAIPVLIRRRRAGTEEVTPPIDIDAAMRDYTSQPYEEPTRLADRLRGLSIGTKLLLVLVPVGLIVAAVIAFLTLRSPGNIVATQAAPPPKITDVQANVAGENKIVVTANTNLPNGAPVTVALKENGQDFAWFNPQSGSAQASDGQIRATLERLKDAPKPKQDQDYTIVLTTQANDQTINSDPAKLDIPAPLRDKFFQIIASVPTSAPTVVPPSEPTATALPGEPTATAPPSEPTATPALSLTASVFNGGNIRSQPKIQTCTCPQLHAGEVVQLLEKTADGRWLKVIAPEGTGWVSVTLLRIDGEVAKQVPIEGQQPPPVPGGTPEAPTSALTAKVFHGGNVREKPVSGRPLDQINVDESVQLIEKTADGIWYKITNARSVTGWVHISLLRIDREVARQVPIAK